MFGNLQKMLQGALAPAPQPQDEAARLRLATAVLLLEAAHADDEFTDEERTSVHAMVRARFGLSEAEATELLAAALQARGENGDLYRFTHQLDESYALPRKLAVVELLWEVVYSDGML